MLMVFKNTLLLFYTNNKKTIIMTTFKSQAIQLISQKDFGKVHSTLQGICFGGDTNNLGKEIMQLVVENSNDFTKDIAAKWLEQYDTCPCDIEAPDGSPAEYVSRLSDKQIWCVVYQIKNNINVYSI